MLGEWRACHIYLHKGVEERILYDTVGEHQLVVYRRCLVNTAMLTCSLLLVERAVSRVLFAVCPSGLLFVHSKADLFLRVYGCKIIIRNYVVGYATCSAF